MSKKFKSQASSARAASAAFGAPTFGFGVPGDQTGSSLSYVSEQPDLTGISDPNIVVSLRNLGKKDSITKTKALEDLQEYVNAQGSNLQEAFLAVWIDLYPRTSIDNARRVRQLAHSLQGAITSSSGKRIAPLLSKAIGAWLCGLFDNDRSVARSAQDALATAFNTEDRRKALWKIYRDSLLDYAEDATMIQTGDTLSDARSTSKEDSEAKYARVVASALLMLRQLIKQIQQDPKKPILEDELLQRIIVDKRLWDFAHHDDPYLRHSFYSFSTACIEGGAELDWPLLSTAFVSKGLQVSQLGSAAQFTRALLVLTQARPEIWTSDYHAKTTSSKRLLRFLERGSQRGTDEVWNNISALFKTIPADIFANPDGVFGIMEAFAVVDALRDGVANVEEPRQNMPAAWSCYTQVCYEIDSRLARTVDRDAFYLNYLVAVVIQYTEGSLPLASNAGQLCSDIALFLVKKDRTQAFAKLWSRLGDVLEEKMRLSLPETSKQFLSSQEVVVRTSDRIFGIAKSVANSVSKMSKPSTGAVAIMAQIQYRLISASIDLLRNRNGKPFGAAAVLQDAVSEPEMMGDAYDIIHGFVLEQVPGLMTSPSAERLIWLTRSLKLPLMPLLNPLLLSRDLNPYGEGALAALLSSVSAEDLGSSPELSPLLSKSLSEDQSSFTLPMAVLRNPSLRTSAAATQIVSTLNDGLASDASPSQQRSSLDFLRGLLSDPATALVVGSDDLQMGLTSKLLHLKDSQHDEISELASTCLDRMKTQAAHGTAASTSTASIVAEQLLGSEPLLPILSLIELGIAEYKNADDKKTASEKLMPVSASWTAALQPHLSNKRPLSLTVTSTLQGAVDLLTEPLAHPTAISYDSEGLSHIFRLSLYVTRLLSSTDVLDAISDKARHILFQKLPLALQLVNEKLTLDSANFIWIEGTGEVFEEAADILSLGNAQIQSWLEYHSSQFLLVVNGLSSTVQDSSVESYITALSIVDVASRDKRQDALAQIFPDIDPKIKLLHRCDNILEAATLASSARDQILSSASGKRLLNELVSLATELKTVDDSSLTLQPLILLNILLNGESDSLDSVQSPRLVFLMQNLVRLLDSGSRRHLHQVFKLLSSVMPAVQDIYGEHWQQVLVHIQRTWEDLEDLESDLPLVQTTLRLYQRLKNLAATKNANEDLFEAWTDAKPGLNAGLIQCLRAFDAPSETMNQPRQITAELLKRLLASVELKVEDVIDTLRLISAQDDAVVGAAYSLLHRAVPKRQEDLSMDLILEKQVIHLPPELMSMIAEEILPTSRTSTTRFLLAWALVFDHFPTAAHRLREAYTADLKDADRLGHLLDSICETIRLTTGRPLDVSKWNIQDFELEQEEYGVQEMQHLSVYLYYRALLFVPGLVKAWFIEQKNRIRSPLQSWTQKYISPSIIGATLTSVTEWAKTQDPDDTPVEVKTNPKSRELIASMAIDPESPPISIAVELPGSFPLEAPDVDGRTRIGVSDRNWKAWIRTIKIIIFNTGSIIDGLIAFRRNTQGAIKGHGECAICYSIIGPDMRTPSKKCMTCKNGFHSVCLFKWFQNSNSSSCPLCRNNFNYG